VVFRGDPGGRARHPTDIPVTVDGATELGISVPRHADVSLPLPIAAWHATVGRTERLLVLDARPSGGVITGPQKDAKHPAMTDTDERSGEAESDHLPARIGR